MNRRLLAALGLAVCAAPCGAADFHPPVRLKAGDAAIRVEPPGYACPAWADVDGKKHLIVGQFAGGKMQVFKNLGGTKFAAGTWLQAEGKVAEGEKIFRDLIASPTILVSKEQATMALARAIMTTRPDEARKLVEPLRAHPRNQVSRNAVSLLGEIPAKK